MHGLIKCKLSGQGMNVGVAIKPSKDTGAKMSHMVAVKVLCNDSAAKSVPALQRDGLHQPDIQSLRLL